MASQGTFRADLFYRINCMQVELPPLRHRRAHLTDAVVHGELAEQVHPVHAASDFFQYGGQHQADLPRELTAPAESLLDVLARYNGNRRLAAEALGITERTLYR